MQKLKTLTLSLIIGLALAGTVTAAAVWQGTSWITDGATISASKIKSNLEHMYNQLGPSHTASYATNSRYGYFEGRRLDGTRGFYLGYGDGLGLVNLRLDNASNLNISGGNVGINTNTPSSKLEVAGNIEADSYCDRNGANCSTASNIVSIGSTVSPASTSCSGYTLSPSNVVISGGKYGVQYSYSRVSGCTVYTYTRTYNGAWGSCSTGAIDNCPSNGGGGQGGQFDGI